MDPITAAARACAAEIGRRHLKTTHATALDGYDNTSDFASCKRLLPETAEVASAPRPMVDGDLCASPGDAAFGARLSRWRHYPAGMAVVGEGGPDLNNAWLKSDGLVVGVDIALGPDATVFHAPCGCCTVRHAGFENIAPRTTHHYCAKHGKR